MPATTHVVIPAVIPAVPAVAPADAPSWLVEMRDTAASVRDEDRRDRGAWFTVVHRWHAHTLAPIAIEAMQALGMTPLRQNALRALHLDALDALPAEAATWRATYIAALRDLIGFAYAHERANAVAYAGGHRYATDHGFEDPEGFGRYYAELNTEASLALCARTHAAAMADLLSEAFADGDARAYVDARPESLVALYLKAWLRAQGRDVNDAQAAQQLRDRIAEGWIAARAAA